MARVGAALQGRHTDRTCLRVCPGPTAPLVVSHPYMTTGKTIALTSRTFVGKVMSLLFNMLHLYSWPHLLLDLALAIIILNSCTARR